MTWRTPSDRELVARLVDQARAEGVDLVGENGLTKLVLKSALEDASAWWRSACRAIGTAASSR
ncbi:hypothetical protein [Nonomuraea angiospora]|uniref:hypothetical protein n=1 Tax=Nonomuraea angiospora TaxID=46172 RepID=UPI003F541298